MLHVEHLAVWRWLLLQGMRLVDRVVGGDRIGENDGA